MTPCSPLNFTRRFGGTYRLHFQGRRIVQQTSEQAGGKQKSYKFEAIFYYAWLNITDAVIVV
jgi:hypothetical protein